jgi:predicted nucleic acid-binding Zn finger protein
VNDNRGNLPEKERKYVLKKGFFACKRIIIAIFLKKKKKVRELFTNLLLSKKSEFFFTFNGVKHI